MLEANVLHLSPPGNPLAQIKALSVELELALLGAALVNQASLDAAAPFVSEVDFSDPFLGSLWAVMRQMHGEGVKLTPMLISARISNPETIASVQKAFNRTPIQLMAQMAANAITVVNAPDYGKQVRDLRLRRDLYGAGIELQTAMLDPAIPLAISSSVMSTAVETVLNSAPKLSRSMRSMITDALDAIETDAPPPGVTTGLVDLDRRIGGFIPSDLIVLGARPSMGKSAASISTLVQSALASWKAMKRGEQGWATLLITTEMTHEQCVQRALTDLAMIYGVSSMPVPYLRFRPAPGQTYDPLSDMQMEGMHKAGQVLQSIPFAVDGRPGMTITEVTSMVRSYKKRFASKGIPLKVVGVDHIGSGKILPVARAGQGVVQEMGEVTTSLKGCAVNEQVCILAAHQLSRANEGRENKRPTLADFRDSGHIEQDADIMLGLYRDAYYYERTKDSDPGKEIIRKQKLDQTINQMEVYVLKARMGQVGSIDLWVMMATNSLRNANAFKDQ